MSKKQKPKVISDLSKGMAVEEMMFAVKSGGLTSYANKPGKYIRLQCSDSTGSITVILWDDKGSEKTWKHIEEAHVIEVDGKVDEYNGDLQITATDIFPVSEGDYDPSDLLPSIEISKVDEMWEYLMKNIKFIKNKNYKLLLNEIFLKNKELIYKQVGGKAIHHAKVGGWILHTYEVLTMVNTCGKLYKDNIDMDLLRTGTLLHDIGKIICYDLGATIERNDTDYLTGHIFAGVHLINDAIAKNNKITLKFGDNDYIKLMHMVNNHHDNTSREFSETLMLEVILLRKCDVLSCIADRFVSVKHDNPDRDVYFDNVIGKQFYLN